MIKVLKFGGTSVGSAQNMKRVAEIVRREQATVTVLSAMSGTTDALVQISKLAADGDLAAIGKVLDMLRDKYSTCIDGLLTATRQKAFDRMEAAWTTILAAATDFQPYTSERTIIAQGELLTSAIFTQYLVESGSDAVCLNAPDFMITDADTKVNAKLLHERLSALTADKKKFYVTQGFICTNYRGEIDNLGRGGSDYSAALMGAAIDAGQVQIWTDIDGMHNNDPRFVDHTYPIRTMSFCEAAELAYFGAKILHPSTIQPCQDHGIPVLLKNTMDPDAPGTTISDADESTQSFHAVAAKDGITVIRIYSARMLMAYGFLRKVFEVFEQYRTPIDAYHVDVGLFNQPDISLGSRRFADHRQRRAHRPHCRGARPVGQDRNRTRQFDRLRSGPYRTYRYRTRRTGVRRVKAGPDQNDLLRSEPPQHHDADQHAGQEANAAIPERLPFQPAIIHFRTILPPQNRV